MIVANGKISQKPVLSVIPDHPKNLAVPSNSTLPQTGNDNNQAKADMGLGLTSLGTMMAMFGLKKRRHN